MHALDDGWQTPAPEPDGQGTGRADAGGHGRPGGAAGRDRPRASHRDGALRTRRTTGSSPSTTGCSGSTRPPSGCSPTTTSGTSGAGPGRRAMHAGRCSRPCPPACGRGSGSGVEASCTRPSACLRAALEQDRMWGGSRTSVSRSRGASRSAVTSTGATSAPRARWPTRLAGPLFGEGATDLPAGARAPARRRGPLRSGAGGPRRRRREGIAIANPAWNPWRGIKAAALHGLGRDFRGDRRSPRRRWRCSAGGVRRATSAGGCACWESCAAATGSTTCARRSSLLSPTPAAVDLARAQCALGSRPAGRGRGGDPAPAGGEQDRRADAAPTGCCASPARSSSDAVTRLEPGDEEVAPTVLDRTADPGADRRWHGRPRGGPATVRHAGDRPGRARGGRLRRVAARGSGFSQVGRIMMGHGQDRRLP